MEKDWREMFQVEQVEKPFQMNAEHGECDSSCLDAKELKCVCRCGGKNHGANLRKNVKSLDMFEDPVEATFNPEEYLQELAILA
ncbi:MAG: hypothetical protein ABSF63_08155 [Candidatus Bathyarchaeia archaeon]|jgi:sugar lactone lactonase YvrE